MHDRSGGLNRNHYLRFNLGFYHVLPHLNVWFYPQTAHEQNYQDSIKGGDVSGGNYDDPVVVAEPVKQY